jgi:cell division protein FtsB
MINSIIKITCKQCNNLISIKIKSIDDLQLENENLKKEIENLKIKLSAMDFMNKNKKEDYGNIMDFIFKKFKSEK